MSRASGTTPQTSTVTNQSGWPASTVEPTAISASHGGLDWPGAPGIGSQTERHSAARVSWAGSSAGPASIPVPNRLRAATRLATTVSTVVATMGFSQGCLGRSSATELKSSPVSSSSDDASASPATERYRSETAPPIASAATRRLPHHGGRNEATTSSVPGSGSMAAVRVRRSAIRPGCATNAAMASTSSRARPGTLPSR